MTNTLTFAAGKRINCIYFKKDECMTNTLTIPTERPRTDVFQKNDMFTTNKFLLE